MAEYLGPGDTGTLSTDRLRSKVSEHDSYRWIRVKSDILGQESFRDELKFTKQNFEFCLRPFLSRFRWIPRSDKKVS